MPSSFGLSQNSHVNFAWDKTEGFKSPFKSSSEGTLQARPLKLPSRGAQAPTFKEGLS